MQYKNLIVHFYLTPCFNVFIRKKIQTIYTTASENSCSSAVIKEFIYICFFFLR